MADKPLYYGGSGSSPLYYGGGGTPAYGGKSPLYYGGGVPAYGGKSPMYYGGGTPAYYGGNAPSYGGGQYGGAPYGGAYGGYGAPSQNSGEEGSLVGTITLGRMLRVVAQRWLSIFVFLLIGLIGAFAVYRISPTIYEARSEFTMDLRNVGRGNAAIDQVMPDYGAGYAEIFNTRLSEWRSDKIATRILQQYRSNHPASTVSDEEVMSTLGGARLELQRGSRIITITVRSQTPALAAALANAYAESIEQYTDEDNKIRCDKAVMQVHENVEKQRRLAEKIAKEIVEFRTANKVDNLRSTRDTLKQSLDQTTGDILALESSETQLVEWEKMLSAVQKDPASYGSLSSGVPRAQEIQSEFRAYQEADNEYQKLLFAYTDNHPQVIGAKRAMELSKKRFLDAATRALQTGRSTLQMSRNQLANLRNKQEDLRNELISLEQRIVLAESGLDQLEAEYGVAKRVHENLQLDENKARLAAEADFALVRVGRPANVPSGPVLPNPTMIFGAGIVISLACGLLFVLVLDNLEDTIVSLSDIEGRLSLKVLAVLPHVRRKKREQVAKFAIEDKYSQFSEAVAGLRNLLDSPRYESLTKCMLVISTQPGEGKTITSTSVAISYAQTGKKVLLVDFDMRRPRMARVWDLKLDPSRSFSHVMQASTDSNAVPDFAKLVNDTRVDNLKVIASLPPEGISPSTILGSTLVADFFEWARANFDRIIIDSPPYGIIGDVVSLSTMVDSVIIMCCPDRTHFKPILYCSRRLTESGATILGVVVNDVEVSNASAFSPTSHHTYRHAGSGTYNYNYGYGNGYKSTSGAETADDGIEPMSRQQDEEFSDDE